jgi:hypothetical protein
MPYSASALRLPADTEGRLAASVYSLPSSFFDPAEAQRFLDAVRRLDRKRTIIVLADPPLAARLDSKDIVLIDTGARSYSPWPRDPMSFAFAGDRVVLLVRPNLQRGREQDAHLAREILDGLPKAIDRAWGGARWAEAPTPFHNGQVLLTKDAAWVTLHTLEPLILEELGLAAVPVGTFATAAGIDRYVEAAEKAGRRLGALYGRPVRFVHPLPAKASGDAALMRTIGGGAGTDLDSVLTLLPHGQGLAALVADVSVGRALISELPKDDLAALRSGYGLAPEEDALRSALLGAQDSRRAGDLTAFLDLVADHLAKAGLTVRRLPLLVVPTALLGDGPSHPDFLVTWNNVVVEKKDGRARAEGFSALSSRGDTLACATFAALGVHLDLLPPLIESIVANGGYRCASNHLRR